MGAALGRNRILSYSAEGERPPAKAPPSDDALHAALARVNDPEIKKPITELGMLEAVDVTDDGHVQVTVLLTVPGCPLKDTITRDTEAAVAKVDGVTGVTVTLGTRTETRPWVTCKSHMRSHMSASAAHTRCLL